MKLRRDKQTYVIGAILIALVAAAIFTYTRNQPQSLIDYTGSKDISGVAGIPQPADNGMMEYRSDAYGFALTYPAELGAVTDHDESDGARTIVFEGSDKAFQIYIRPYTSTTITREEFLQDNPSGVMNDPVDVLIDGVRATLFYGRVEGFGDTREVWFLHNGYLYEVITYKELDTWLAEIMKSWTFI